MRMPPESLGQPDEAQMDPAAVELMRLWVANRCLCMSLRPELEAEPSEFGVLLADLFSHACRAYAGHVGGSEADIRATMFLAFARRMGDHPEETVRAYLLPC
ncbi:DUF5076 domain-containing protein [Lysobacter panacisoli]|nr:DUF5076 domain-containing protein [Lysobacter panacisoli]